MSPPLLSRRKSYQPTPVESDAKQRLGERLAPSGRRILSSLAVRLPVRLKDFSGQPLKDEILNTSDFDMTLYTGESPDLKIEFKNEVVYVEVKGLRLI